MRSLRPTTMPKPAGGSRQNRSGVGLAERIISACDRDNPADRVLREYLKAERDMMPSDARAISQTVFNYFRWRGWLDPDSPLNQQIRKARELAANFTAE